MGEERRRPDNRRGRTEAGTVERERELGLELELEEESRGERMGIPRSVYIYI